MSSFSNSPAQNFEYLAITIEDVDMENRLVHATDRTDSIIQISYRDHPGGVAVVPAQGQRWIAVRLGHTWFLDKQMDSEEEQDVMAGYQPGDMRISTPGIIRIYGDELTFNDGPVGGAPTTEEFERPADGFDTQLLAGTPAQPEGMQVYLNGLQLPDESWEFDEGTNTITFSPEVGEAGYLRVVYS